MTDHAPEYVDGLALRCTCGSWSTLINSSIDRGSPEWAHAHHVEVAGLRDEIHRLRQRLDEATRADSDDLWLIANDEWARQRIAFEAEVARLRTWPGIMSVVDEHYPIDVFPTEDDRAGRDDGPRILSLLRRLPQPPR